jgi:hypothetical protein
LHYQPPRALGLLVGVLLTVWSGGVAVLLANGGIAADNGLQVFVTFLGATIAGALAVAFAFWTYSLATLSYLLDRNGLVISWGPTRQIVPLRAIRRLVPASSMGVPRIRGVSWWGHHVGQADVGDIGTVLFYSTHQTTEQVLYVMTAEQNYAISVEDPEAFAREVVARQELGPTAEVTHHVERSGASLESFWADPRARWLAVAALIGLAFVWGQVALRYGSLPQTLALPFPTGTDVVAVGGREAILELPRTATVLLVVNLVLGVILHAWDRMAGYALFAAAVAVQAGIFIAIAIALR